MKKTTKTNNPARKLELTATKSGQNLGGQRILTYLAGHKYVLGNGTVVTLVRTTPDGKKLVVADSNNARSIVRFWNIGVPIAPDGSVMRVEDWPRAADIQPLVVADTDPDDELDDSEAARLVELAARGRDLSETEKKALVLSRRGQGQFRQDVITLWRKCAITGCRDARLLRASHLKPWKQCTNSERLDPFNGVLLAAHLDTALDCGLITFTDDGRIQFSSKLSQTDSECLGIQREMKLRHVDERHKGYLNFHRENVFLG